MAFGIRRIFQQNSLTTKRLRFVHQVIDLIMAEYRRPFAAPGEGRRPTLTFRREIPIEGDPADVT
jgi:haloalkane dehalogenase